MKKYYIDETNTNVKKDLKKLKKKHPNQLDTYKNIKKLLEVNPQHPSDLNRYMPRGGYRYRDAYYDGKPVYHIRFFAENRIKYIIKKEVVEITSIEIEDTDEIIGIIKLLELLGHDPI